MEKARTESRKLLSHILAQLEARVMPPPVLENAEAQVQQTKRGISAVMKSFSAKGKGLEPNQGNSVEDIDEDCDSTDRPVFFTDATLKLMIQLKDTLHISIHNKWDIFAAEWVGLASRGPGRLNSLDKPRRKRRLSSQGRSRSRSSSPNRYQGEPTQAPELLSQCLSILSSVVLEDCRFKVYAPSLFKPPHALQGMTLDVAQILIHLHRQEPRILSQIGFAVVPAFQTFPPSMHLRLLSFFDDGVLGGMLEGLQKLQGIEQLPSPTKDSPEGGIQDDPPLVSITVEEAQDETHQNDRWQRWSKRPGTDAGSRSSSGPEQELAVYYLSSLIEPLLSVVLENVDLFGEATPVTHRFHRLFTRLANQKPDVYLDVLGVVAYHNPGSRHAAVSLLASYWPKAVGHVVVSRPLPELANSAGSHRPDRRSSVTRRAQHVRNHPYAHQFIPWRFARPLTPVIFDNFAPNHCRACTEAIEGFGLLCLFCMCAVHFDCYDYPEGSFFTEYSLQNDPDIRKVAVHRCCHVLPHRHGSHTLTVRKEQHLFRMVNIFSMSLCCLCHKPLWGLVTQGYKCGACHLFIHPSCLSTSSTDLPRCRTVTIDSRFVTIPYLDLRRSFVDYYADLILTEEDLASASHEEVSVFFSILWIQEQILDNGIAMGSLVVSHDSSSEEGTEIEEFELQYLVQLYEAYLTSGRLPVSNSLLDYLSENRLDAKDHLLYFDWNTLAFMASVIKLPPSSETSDNGDANALLSVSQAGNGPGGSDAEPLYPFEIASLAHIRDRMGDTLGIHRDSVARHLLVYLHHLGLFDRHDAQAQLFKDEVETLVATVEACLSDVSLTVNEIGLLLLVRRFWPNGMLSDYSFRRLAKAILTWILSEDSNVAMILREYVARNRNLPGVRSGEAQSWPPQPSARPTGSVTASNGGEYIATRRALLSRYAGPWMLALHDLDIMAYAAMLYDLLCEYAEDGVFIDPFRLDSDEAITRQKQFLRSIIKVSQVSLTFTAFDDLFQRWLARVQDDGNYELAIPSLPRLFTREDGSQRSSLVFEGRASVGDSASLVNVNPMQKLMEISFSNRNGYRQGLRWLCIFASSGVDIPVSAFFQFAASVGRYRADLEDCMILVRAGLYSAWLRSIGRQELQAMIGMLQEHLSSDIVTKIWENEAAADALAFVRQSLAVCLVLYGCDRQYLVSYGLVREEEIKHLPSRRKVTSRASTMSDPVIVDANLMNAVKVYVEQHHDGLSIMLAKFFNAFVSQSVFVESYEVDNFVLRNSATMSACIWDFYAIQTPELALVRASLFLRIMVVDQQPLTSLLLKHLQHDDWETRLETVLRLFRITLDITNPAFVVEDRQWGPSITDVFRHFFSAIWADVKEEIRLAAETWARTLLPGHFDGISRCWNETLNKAPIAERLKLVNFLLQLRPHFPSWRLLGWGAVIDTLLETDFIAKNGNAGDGGAASHLVALISLSLAMIADGITIDLFSLLRLKDQLVRTLGYQDVATIPSANGHTFHVQFRGITSIPSTAFPCITDIMLVVDSAHPYELSCSAMGGPDVEDETPYSLLVGSAFVDIVLGLFSQVEDPASLPPLVLKNLLKTLIIAMQKHDFDSRAMRHLQGELRTALRCCLTLLLNEEQLSIELRQLALSNCQVFINRWPNVMGIFVYEALEGIGGLMITLQYEDHPEDSLVIQAKAFLEGVMTQFYGRGILNALFKRVLPSEFFKVLGSAIDSKTFVTGQTSLKDALLQDTLSRAPDNEAEYYQLVLDNLCSFVEAAQISHLSADVLQFVGLSLTNIAYKVAEWPIDSFDASSLLTTIAVLIQNNKAHSRDFLVHATTVMRLLISRCKSSSSALSKILQVTSALYRRADRGSGNPVLNQIASAFADGLSGLLLGRSKPIPSSLSAAIEQVVLPNVAASCIPPDRFMRLAEDGLGYLHLFNAQSPWHQDFTTCQAIAKLVLQASGEHNAVGRDIYIETPFSIKTIPLGVRTWNMILLASLSVNDSKSCVILLRYFSAFSTAYYASLEPLQATAFDNPGLASDIEPSIISRAYISLKLWLLVVHKSATFDEGTGASSQEDLSIQGCRMVWNELWPPFESVVLNLHQNNVAANSLLIASSSVADLFLFIHQMRMVIAMEASSQADLLNQLRSNVRLESKVRRLVTYTSARLTASRWLVFSVL
ncbi:hypothetical protein PHLGIDRAFT_67270 [Phlebiopsis gigantea 11061_1 CR5-6]|uniref:Phorbol-ester/DAG-type domain-containing protein n=1 Tax=Phlebiopsis gigantea (strain 11061_1 CR5-6) TaxID=745531 RepID=A0A0C3PQX9_PHLG1|nr:hypothetical protein PHLGIDRAFT_67270 [Phlebiopsis gigantea 11061_1 CR5-6]